MSILPLDTRGAPSTEGVAFTTGTGCWPGSGYAIYHRVDCANSGVRIGGKSGQEICPSRACVAVGLNGDWGRTRLAADQASVPGSAAATEGRALPASPERLGGGGSRPMRRMSE